MKKKLGNPVEQFAFKWRVIEPWHELDGISFITHAGNIFNSTDMLNPQPSSLLGRYVAQVREWGFNAMVVLTNPEQNLEAVYNFALYLKENGIGIIIFREWAEVENGYSWPFHKTDAISRASPKLSPYNADVRAYWKHRIARDYAVIPNLTGYAMYSTEFYLFNGAPWMGEDPMIKTKTGRESTRDAIRLIAGMLEEYGGTLFWDASQDDPWGLRHEVNYFSNLTGEIPENAYVKFTRNYWFQTHWPRHPLYDLINKDAQDRSPYITCIHQPMDHRGVHDFPWSMVDERSEAFRDMAATGQQGVWVGAHIHPDGWDHPFNMADWYAIAWYIRDPYANPAVIKLTWAQEQFGEDVAPAVVEIIEKVTEAAKGLFMFDSMWTANSGRFPTLEYLDSHLCGPYRQSKRMTKMMGLVLPLDMYAPEREAEYRANPKTRIPFNQIPITSKLKTEAMAQKDRAVRLMDESIALWNSLEDKLDEIQYRKILTGLEGNLDDTIIFRYMMDLYMDWKLGVLTEEKIDSVLASCRGRHGIVVPDPLDESPPMIIPNVKPASLKTFAEQLRRDLQEPWVERYFQDQSIGVGVSETVDWELKSEKDNKP